MYNRSLKTFMAVADCGSFIRAGEKCHLSPTAVKKQIDALEYRLGVELFVRGSHGVRLTAAGESVYKDARFVIAYCERAVVRARRQAEAGRSLLRIGTSMLNPCKVFMDLWNTTGDAFPQFKIQIVPFDDDNVNILSVIESLGEKFDFLVGACSSELWLSRCCFYPLGTYKICCAVSRRHPLAAKEKLSPADLHGEHLMMVRQGDAAGCDVVRQYLKRAHPQVIIEDTPQFYDIGVFNRCEEENKVLLTLDCWADVHPSLATIPVDWPFEMPYGLLYSPSAGENVKRFLDLLRKNCPPPAGEKNNTDM